MLVFYVGVQLKPLTAIIQDTLAHTFWKVKHLATAHHNHGHHHLHQELQQSSVDEHEINHTEKPANQKLNEEISTHVLNQFNFDFINTSIFLKKIQVY
jgi:hypothetical protein